MTEQMYEPEAVLLVQDHLDAVFLVKDHLMELIDCYAGLRPNEAPQNALVLAFATVFSPQERIIVSTFIEGGSDPILGEGTGAQYMADMESIFEACRGFQADAPDALLFHINGQILPGLPQELP